MNLDPSPEEIRKWGGAAFETLAAYLGSIRNRAVYSATPSADIRAKLDRNLPYESAAFDELLNDFREVVIKFSRQNAHPRMFGYVQSPGTVVAGIADLLASTLNANLTAWRSAPVAVEIERLTIDWIKQLVGYPVAAGGLFVSGGSMANLVSVAAARTSRTPATLATEGARALPSNLCMYASTETHHSVEKAAVLLGIGRHNVRKIPVNERHKIRIDDLVATISRDIRAGHLPFCVVANGGTVMTGAVDPLRAVSEVARQFNLWMHVDGAYGGFATIAASVKPLFAGLELADSIALDAHKWLYLPIDCGCVLYRDSASAVATFSHDAEYTRVIGHDADEAFAFWDYGPELSRRFRALKVWMIMRSIGLRALGEAIEKDLACARYLEKLVLESEDFQMLAPVELSIFCFRHIPAHLREGISESAESARENLDQELNVWNEKLLVALQRDGSSYLSNALIGTRFALRGCVMNYRTTTRDMETLLEDLRRVATTVLA
ncbi:MAG: pyridoxal phosphate-dependent decarboxylase family protein [Chthoniobacterales bacterium]